MESEEELDKNALCDQFYSTCTVIKEALESFGNFKIGHIICTVQCVYDLVLLAEKEMMLQGMIYRITENGRHYGMEINVEKTKVMRISKQPSTVQIMIYQNNWRM